MTSSAAVPSPPIAADETQRLAALDRLRILDTPSESAYDDLVALASEVCRTPIALVSLVDRDRQWFKAQIGLEAPQTDRDHAFCAHAIAGTDAVFTVPDTTRDARFSGNPLVTGDPNIRFYAGAPIVTPDGHALGTVCVIDTEPRSLTASQLRCLGILAKQAAGLLELRQRAVEAARVALDQVNLTTEARLKLEQGAELLDLVLQGRELGLWDLDVTTGRWSASVRELAMLGHANADAVPADWHALVHPDDRAVTVSSMAPHLRGESPFYECTHRIRHADGRWIWVLCRAVVVERGEDGRPLRIVGTHADITEQRRLETERRQGAERLELALAGGDIGLWDADVPSGNVVYNAQWGAMLGYSLDELEREPDLWTTRVHPDDGVAFSAGLKALLRNERPILEVEGRMRHKDGHWVWILTRAKVFERDADGRAVRLVGTNLNITARKSSAVALEKARNLLDQTAALARVGGWAVDLVDQTVSWSREVYRIHEVDDDWVPDLPSGIDFYAPQARPVIRAAVEGAIADGTTWDLELPFDTARGRRIWVRTQGQAEHEDGVAVRLVGVFQDITERKQAELARVEGERRLRMITDHMPALIMRIDSAERYTFVNAHFGRVFGIEPDQVIGRTMREVCSGAIYADIAPHVARALAGEPTAFEAIGQARGADLHYQSHYVPDRDEDGRVVGFYALIFDVTARKHAELRSIEAETLLRGLTDNLPACIAAIDRDGRFRFANATYAKWLGIEPADMIGRTIDAAIGERYFAGRAPQIVRALAGEGVTFEQTLPLLTGERTLHSSYVPHFDDHRRVAGFYAMTSDITELKAVQRKLDALARADALTGLPNRRHFEERAIEALARARRTGRPGALFYLDVDRFKSVNDTLGHAGGDELLQQFADRLANVLRESDFVARYAGDEFVAIAEGVDGDVEARALAEKIAATIRVPFSLVSVCLRATTSIGIATFDGTESLRALLGRADDALYAAKAAGRDAIRLCMRARAGEAEHGQTPA